ncbi:MAG: 4Fe-4S dicluster domain-containing protein, partial [Bacteroidales bacterium]|nr:4Fe-4S dicluster domain-containing protein [Bacteroidales bacterium]
QEIDRQFPDPEVRRRNNGYALDALCHTAPFESGGAPLNLSRLMAGSEGTLLFLTAVKLHLEPRPAPVRLLSCVHLTHLEDAFEANLLALGHVPTAVELMDRTILECTRKNREQQANRFFVQGDPAALLIVEFTGDSAEALTRQAGRMEEELAAHGLGYSYVHVTGSDVAKVWALRKAGLGVLSNMPGDAKPVSLIEDTAVAPAKLAAYIRDLDGVMARHGLSLVYHGHISTGELHLRPVLDLKRAEDVVKFRQVATEIARIVRKYRGSLSGEHGDGRLRGEFIPLMYGDTVYRWFCELKNVFDPDGIFNAGKITGTPAMDTHLRYVPGQPTRQIETMFDFSAEMGMMRAVEKCNGAGDCRKPQALGGLMCPTYKVLRDEWASTRGRANLLREVLTRSGRDNPFDDAELFRLMDTCLSCKDCKRECLSGIDMAKLKSEFLYHYYQSHRPSLRTRLIAGLSHWNRMASATRPGTAMYNAVQNLSPLKRALGIAPRRMPQLKPDALYRRLMRKTAGTTAIEKAGKNIWLGVDEFTHDYFPEVAAEAVRLLQHFGYHVVPVRYDSGRALISKGMLRAAREKAGKNVRRFAACVSADMPLVGLEPSCILSFGDEYPELVRKNLQDDARNLARHTYAFDAFFMREVAAGRIPSDAFRTEEPLRIWVHGHCQQKALTGDKDLCAMLSLAPEVRLEYIPSGCCGMAGSFGYEAEHYELSKQVGELVLFPTIRKAEARDLIVAPGFSCRHHIEEGTGRKALHPVTCMLRLAALS